MGVDYACVIGLGVQFPDTFIRRLPRTVVDKIDGAGHGWTVFVTINYENLSMAMYGSKQVQLIPPISMSERTRESILEDAWNVLGLSDSERVIMLYLLKEHDDLVVGSMIQHYSW